jgi:hypothetical protein
MNGPVCQTYGVTYSVTDKRGVTISMQRVCDADQLISDYISFESIVKVSISPTFYIKLFLDESVFTNFSLLAVWLCYFLAKDYWCKSGLKKLEKLTKVVNFTNILQFKQLFHTKVFFATFLFVHFFFVFF